MRLRADTGEVDEALVDWWQEFSTGDADMQQDLVDQVRQEQAKRPRVAKVQRAPSPQAGADRPASARTPRPDAAAPASDASSDEDDAPATGDAPRKRRRRRRSSAGGGTPDTPSGGL